MRILLVKLQVRLPSGPMAWSGLQAGHLQVSEGDLKDARAAARAGAGQVPY